MILDQDDMIAEFTYAGYPAWPHPFVKEWIMMSMHHQENAFWMADHHGWEPAQMGWKPKQFVKRAKIPPK